MTGWRSRRCPKKLVTAIPVAAGIVRNIAKLQRRHPNYLDWARSAMQPCHRLREHRQEDRKEYSTEGRHAKRRNPGCFHMLDILLHLFP